MVWIEHNGWEIEITEETAENPSKLAEVIALLQLISEL